ncbi:MAG: hypothetical protein R3E39_24975 [Anaerolineae bacterium]
MRSDLIAAGMIHRWLSANAPELIDGWAFECPDDLNVFLERANTIMPGIDAQFTSQGSVARTAIELWDLKDVVLLGGGMPTPLTPKPEQVRYYTDLSHEVVNEVGQMGYNTQVADVKKVDDLKALGGAQAAVATGLFHFLEDDAVGLVLDNLAQAGFHTLVFNNMGTNIPEDLIVNWTKLGYKLIAREPEDVPRTLRSGWRVQDALTMPRFFASNQQLGPKLVQLDNIYYIYRLVRD